MKKPSLQKQLERDLQELKLNRIAETYTEVLDEAARKQISMLEVLASLIGEEATVRNERALQRRLNLARLPERKTLEQYNFSWPKICPKDSILRLFDLDFINRAENAVLIGGTGLGKTHLLIALGYKACEQGFSVRYTRVVHMLNALIKAQIGNNLEKAMRAYTRPSLLLLDELGYLTIDRRGANLLFDVVATRYEKGSIVLTTNRIFRDWGKTLDQDPTVATALIDRLMHHGEALLITGDTYRNPKNKQETNQR